MDAGTRGLDGDGMLVFTGGCVRTRWRENKAEKCGCPGWRTFPITMRRCHPDGMFGPMSVSDRSERWVSSKKTLRL